VIGKIIISSVAQQLINAGLSLIKIRVLYEFLPPIQVGKFALYASLFYVVQFIFDSSRKTILSQIHPDSAAIGNQIVLRLIKRDSMILISTTLLFCSFVILGLGKVKILDYFCIASILLTTLTFSIANTFSSLYSIRFGFHRVSILTGLSNLIVFPFFALCASLGNIPLLIFINFLGNILPGLLLLNRVLGQPSKGQGTEGTEKRINLSWLLGIQIAETSANSLNSIMVASRLGQVSTGEYLLYSKFALLYDFIPIALTPIVIARKNSRSFNIKVITSIILANGILVSILAICIFRPAIQFLSDGNVFPSFTQLIPFLFGGFIISVTSLFIQGTVDYELLQYRFKVSTTVTLLNILFTWILLPEIGLSATYLISGIATSIYAYLLFFKTKNRSYEA
jgi:hypothetical protein